MTTSAGSSRRWPIPPAAILDRLARGSATVGTLAEPLAMTSPAVSQHLKVLDEKAWSPTKRERSGG